MEIGNGRILCSQEVCQFACICFCKEHPFLLLNVLLESSFYCDKQDITQLASWALLNLFLEVHFMQSIVLASVYCAASIKEYCRCEAFYDSCSLGRQKKPFVALVSLLLASVTRVAILSEKPGF